MMAYLLIDIGGTNVRLALVNAADKADSPLWEMREATQIGVKGLRDQCRILFETAKQNALLLNLTIQAVSIGFPANISLDTKKAVIPGSGYNISLIEDEWAGISMQTYFEAVFDPLPVFVINDALAQCWGGLMEKELQNQLHHNDTVVYVGMGTGLGGACCTLDKTLSPQFFTDGHIYDIWIEGPKGKCIAEDWLSGRGVLAYTGHDADFLAQLDDESGQQHWQRLGQDVKQLMQIIKSGNILKRDTVWSASDQSRLKQVDLWLLGASFVKHSPTLKWWLDELDAKENIYVMKEPDSAAMKGLRAQIQF